MEKVIRVENRESSSTIRSYRDLLVWQKSMDLLVEIYEVTKDFPKEELYGLSSQIKRAVVSVPSNIAEGSSRRTTREFIRFINIATGSLAELETQLIAAERLSFFSEEKKDILLYQTDEISRMLQGLHDSLIAKINSDHSTLNSNH